MQHVPVSEQSTPSGDGPVTLINVFEVPAEEVDRFIAGWRERARIMSGAPGFRDSRLHRAMSSEARFQLVNVATWDSREAWEAATANPEFQAQLAAVADDTGARVAANPALYQVAAEYVDGTPG